ncbi:hypothetical protein BJ912DRAFT_950958, partial [Pholiota molesta]
GSSTRSFIRVERSANSSAAGVYPRRQNEAVQVQEASQWRLSRIRAGVPIGKTAAMSKYHISARDLEDLTMTMGTSPAKFNGAYHIMPMHNYIERDVEMKAWEKYGGPERFEEILNKKAATFYRRHGRNRRFPKPRTYILANNPVPATRGEIWLWNSLNKSIAECENNDSNLENHISPAYRESLMLSASETLRDYPKRPTSPPPVNAPSFKALNDLLAQAPSTHSGSNVYVDWKKSYKDKVHGCLDDISREYGIHGLKKAQWLAYDKHVECNMGGLRYYRKDVQPSSSSVHTGSKWMWYDASKSWLNRKQL